MAEISGLTWVASGHQPNFGDPDSGPAGTKNGPRKGRFVCHRVFANFSAVHFGLRRPAPQKIVQLGFRGVQLFGVSGGAGLLVAVALLESAGLCASISRRSSSVMAATSIVLPVVCELVGRQAGVPALRL